MNSQRNIATLQAHRRGTFSVIGLRPDATTPSVDPYLGVDHFRVSGPTFPPHPHAGFSALTYLFRDSTTSVLNRDSLGNRNLIAPGGLHWTAAGRGVVHEEQPHDLAKEIHGLQIFVNLPAQHQTAEPFSLHLEPQDVAVRDDQTGTRIFVPFGEFEGLTSGLAIPTDATLLDIYLEDGKELTLPLQLGSNTFVLAVEGSVTVDGEEFSLGQHQSPVFGPARTPRAIGIRATHGNAHVAVLCGKPLGQPVHWVGGVAMASAAAAERAMLAFRRGEFGTVASL